MKREPVKVEFSAADGLVVSADAYPVPRPKGFVVLCHRSHFNRGEYADVAPRLCEAGFSCLALDQRSGMDVLGYRNETYGRAKKAKLPTGYFAARPDIEAAVAFAFGKNGRKPVLLVGSSYSASLALLIASESRDVSAVAAFSPGEYLKGVRVAEAASKIRVPVFATCARDEIRAVERLVDGVPKKLVTLYRPRDAGRHGARVLWEETPGSDGYWNAFSGFLNRVGATRGGNRR